MSLFLRVCLYLTRSFFEGLKFFLKELIKENKLSLKDFEKLKEKIKNTFGDIKFNEGVFTGPPPYFALEHKSQSRMVSHTGQPMLTSTSDVEKFFYMKRVIWSPRTQSLFLQGTYDGKQVNCILVQGRSDLTRHQLKKLLLIDSETYSLEYVLKIKTT